MGVFMLSGILVCMSNTDHLFFGVGYQKDSSEPIDFLETRFQDLSPFSAHEIELEDVVYKTAEHAYQALRVIGEARASIISARSPMEPDETIWVNFG
jgi:hypothetical protein